MLYQPVAEISIHTCATIETRVCLVWGAGKMRILPSSTATHSMTQDCHRHQWNASSCGYGWYMVLFTLTDASAAVSAVCSHAFINANLGDIYVQNAFHLWRTVSCIHQTFPQSSPMTAMKTPSLISFQNWLLCQFLPMSTSPYIAKGSSIWHLLGPRLWCKSVTAWISILRAKILSIFIRDWVDKVLSLMVLMHYLHSIWTMFLIWTSDLKILGIVIG